MLGMIARHKLALLKFAGDSWGSKALSNSVRCQDVFPFHTVLQIFVLVFVLCVDRVVGFIWSCNNSLCVCVCVCSESSGGLTQRFRCSSLRPHMQYAHIT